MYDSAAASTYCAFLSVCSIFTYNRQASLSAYRLPDMIVDMLVLDIGHGSQASVCM